MILFQLCSVGSLSARPRSLPPDTTRVGRLLHLGQQLFNLFARVIRARDGVPHGVLGLVDLMVVATLVQVEAQGGA